MVNYQHIPIIDDKNVIISDRKSPGGIGHASLEEARRVTELRYAKAVSAPLAPIGSTQSAGRKYSEIRPHRFFTPHNRMRVPSGPLDPYRLPAAECADRAYSRRPPPSDQSDRNHPRSTTG